jgi:hypothetical protein
MDQAQKEATAGGAIYTLVVSAFIALAIGATVYMVGRPLGSVYLLPAGWSLADSQHLRLGWLGNNIPSFVHVYAFGLLTAAVLGASRSLALASCATWWAIDCLFEVGQHPLLSPYISAAAPPWFSNVPVLENIVPYFVCGTFDPWDLVAIALGALAAYGTIVLVRHGGHRHAAHD